LDYQEVKKKSIIGFGWQLAQKLSAKAVSLGVSIYLARLLMPADFGVVAMTSIFLALAGALADSGLGSSLVQKDKIDHLDINTVFFFSLFVSIVLYGILFALSPLIANMYQEPQLVSILRILGINLLFSSLSNVQASIVSRELNFRNFFFASFIATLFSAIVAVAMALAGCGIWTLVGQSISQNIAGIVVLNRILKWRPVQEFSFTRLKQLYSFGLNFAAASLIGTLFNELKGFLIGYKYDSDSLAYNNRGESIPSFISTNISGSISTVLFPAISRLQNDKTAVKASMRRTMMVSMYIMAPLMFLLFVSSEKIIVFLYSEKWLLAVPFMQVSAVASLLGIINNINLQAINAIGRSDIVLRLELYKKPVWLAVLLYTMTISPLAIAIGNAVYSLYAIIINTMPNKKLIDYSYWEQWKDILPQLLLAAVSSIAAYFIGFIQLPAFVIIVLQFLLGCIIYLLLSWLLKVESFEYLKQMTVDFLRQKGFCKA